MIVDVVVAMLKLWTAAGLRRLLMNFLILMEYISQQFKNKITIELKITI